MAKEVIFINIIILFIIYLSYLYFYIIIDYIKYYKITIFVIILFCLGYLAPEQLEYASIKQLEKIKVY